MSASDESPRSDALGSGCPRCGAGVTNRHLGAALVVRCPACGWNVATTSPGFGRGEPVVYSLFMTNGDPERPDQATALADVAGVTADMARRALAEANRGDYAGLVASGDADTIRAAQATLAAASIESFVDPYLD
jgi:hypothetical protein